MEKEEKDLAEESHSQDSWMLLTESDLKKEESCSWQPTIEKNLTQLF